MTAPPSIVGSCLRIVLSALIAAPPALVPVPSFAQASCGTDASLAAAQCWTAALREDLAGVDRPGLQRSLTIRVKRIDENLVDADSWLARGRTVRGRNLLRGTARNAEQLLRQLTGKNAVRYLDPALRDALVADTDGLLAVLNGLLGEVESCDKCDDRDRGTFDVCVEGACRSIPNDCPCFTGEELGAAGLLGCATTEPGLIVPNAAFFAAAVPGLRCNEDGGTLAAAVANVASSPSSCLCLAESGVPNATLTEAQKQSCRALVAARCGAPTPEPAATATPVPTPTPCVPKTCAQRNAECGTTTDGCGALLECGTCDDGQEGTYDVCVQGSCQAIVDDCPCWTGPQLESTTLGGCFFPPDVTGPSAILFPSPGLSCSAEPVVAIGTTNDCFCIEEDGGFPITRPDDAQLLHCADLVSARCGVRDLCPDDPFKVEPGACGCDRSDADANGNGVADCREVPPPPAPPPGVIIVDPVTPIVVDGDGDGTFDSSDGCSLDAAKTAPGACGCGVPDDANGNGQPDCFEFQIPVFEVPSVDLEVDNVITPAATQGVVRHEVKVTNLGPIDAPGTVATLELAPGTTLDPPCPGCPVIQCSQGAPTGGEQNGRLVMGCNFGTVANGGSATMVVGAQPDQARLLVDPLIATLAQLPDGKCVPNASGFCETFVYRASSIARATVTAGPYDARTGNNMAPTVILPSSPPTIPSRWTEECEDDVEGSKFAFLLDVSDCEHDFTTAARWAVFAATAIVGVAGGVILPGGLFISSGGLYRYGAIPLVSF